MTKMSGPGPHEMYQRRLTEGRFEIQQCDECLKYQFYPRYSCRYCGSDQLQWRIPSGKAVVYSTTVVRQRAEKGGDYNVAIVELAEGPRMMSRVDGVAPEEVEIGMQVLPTIITNEGSPLLVFVPATRSENNA